MSLQGELRAWLTRAREVGGAAIRFYGGVAPDQGKYEGAAFLSDYIGSDDFWLIARRATPAEPFAPVGALAEQLFHRAARAGRADLATPHAIALRLFRPALAAYLPAEPPGPVFQGRPGEIRRRAGPEFCANCLHSLIDFLFAVQDELGPWPLIIGLVDLAELGAVTRDLLLLLARRGADRPLRIWATDAVAAAPELLTSLRAHCDTEVIWLGAEPPVARADSVPGTPLELAAAADFTCTFGAWGDCARYARQFLATAGVEESHLLPDVLEALRIALYGLEAYDLAEQLLLQELPRLPLGQARVEALAHLAAHHSERTGDLARGEHYARLARQAAAGAHGGLMPAEVAVLHLYAAHPWVQCCTRQGRFAEALTAGRQALAALGEHAPPGAEPVKRSILTNLLGQTLLRAGEMEQAIAHFQAAIALDPAYPEYYLDLAIAQVQHGRHADALATLAEAVRFMPPGCEYYLRLGEALQGVDRGEEALVAYARGIALDPENEVLREKRALLTQT